MIDHPRLSDRIERLTFTESPKLPPFNLEAEEAIIGSIVLDREVIGRLAPFLEARDFYSSIFGDIYAAALSLFERQEPVDILTLGDAVASLRSTGASDSHETVMTLSRAISAVPTPVHAPEYARTVAGMAYMRRLISAGGKIAALGFQNQLTASEAAAEAERLVRSAEHARTDGQVVAISDELSAMLHDLAQPDDSQVVPTGLIDLDRLLAGGFRRGDLIVLAGRPGMGKSAISMCMAAKLAIQRGGSVLVLSLEMSARSLVERLVATESGIGLQAIMQRRIAESDFYRLGAAFERLAACRLWIEPTPALTVAAIRDRARRLHADNPLDLIVVDHIQLIASASQRGNAVDQLTAISGALKALAKDLSVPVLVLSQLSRAVEMRQPKVPVLSDLRTSGSLEQDADAVLLLYRDAYYNPDSERQGIAELHVAKNRNGPTDRVFLSFNERTTRFDNLEGRP